MPIPIVLTVLAVVISVLARKTSSASEDNAERTFAPDPDDDRTDGGEAGDSATTSMSEADALEVLDLAPGATPDAIREAHRRLIKRLHPDRGGSGYLAGLVNRAKDMLLA